ncbi:MAG: SDR family oxidoreductase [Saprospiraceae bacterium]|nr:SDR family oxidoreductase [Saprospiraceae bacterium]
MNENGKLVILVTGASGGIGQSVAEYLAQQGYIVYGTSRKSQVPGSNFQWIRLDVTNRQDVEDVIDSIIAQEGKLDVLINNAGIGMISSLEEAPSANVKQVMETNFGGVLHLTQAVLPHMRKRRSGKIINISSIAGLIGLPYRSIYSASKFAVEGLTEAVRAEVQKFNIQVCTVQPGSIRTDIKSNRVSYIPEDSYYQPEISIAEDIIDTEVGSGIEAEDVAIHIGRLILKTHLQSKYVVAKPFQKLGTSLKRYLPHTIFEKLLMNRYRSKS